MPDDEQHRPTDEPANPENAGDTQAFPPDERRSVPPQDPFSGGSETTVLPASVSPAAPTTPAGPSDARWSARAGVPAPRSGDYDSGTEQWQSSEQVPGRAWWLPAVLAILAFVLLGALIVGIYLIMQALDKDNPEPPARTPTPTATGTPSPSASPSPSPTPSPTPTAPAAVAVPPVVGLPQALAVQSLTLAGFRPQVTSRVQEGATPGVVIEVQPAAGTLLAPGSQVVLVVAAEPPPPPPTPSDEGSPSPGRNG